MATQSRLGSVSESFDDRRGPERRNEDCSGRGLPKGKEASGPRQDPKCKVLDSHSSRLVFGGRRKRTRKFRLARDTEGGVFV